jgi:hypothetical protein
MPDPDFTRPDLCSICAAAEQADPEAGRGGLSADQHPPVGDYPPVPLTSGVDRAIRLSTAAAVLAVAGIAAFVSYVHAYAVVRAHGETGFTARLEPATIDGLVYASSMRSCMQPGTGCRCPPSPAGCSRWESPLPSPRTWPRAGPTVPSGRWSRPGRRSAWWARTNSWCGSSARPGRQHAGRLQSTRVSVRPAGLRRVLSRPQPLMVTGPERASAARQTRRGCPRVSRQSPPAGSVTIRRLRAALSMTRQ